MAVMRLSNMLGQRRNGPGRPLHWTDIAAYVARFRQAQIEALVAAEQDGRLDVGDRSIEGLVVVLTNVARNIMVERCLGLTTGHQEARAMVERASGAGSVPRK